MPTPLVAMATTTDICLLSSGIADLLKFIHQSPNHYMDTRNNFMKNAYIYSMLSVSAIRKEARPGLQV
jgi:hypothetical protein